MPESKTVDSRPSSETVEDPDRYDVAVIGGGSAGLCAALASARSGAKTVLVERSSKLGGMGTQALVHTFCGLYEPDPSAPPAPANPGLPAEIEREMLGRTGQTGPTLMGRVYVLLQDPKEFNALARDLVAAEKNLTVLYKTTCNGIRHSGPFKIETDRGSLTANSLVDASADAIAAKFLGATRVKSDTPQKPAFIFALQNVGEEACDESFKMRFALDLVRAVQAGTLPEEMLGATFRNSTTKEEVFVTIDLENPADGPELARKLTAFLKKNSPAFKNAGPPAFPDVPGIRETYRWMGKYVLTADDLVNGVEFEDAIAKAAWPLELRESTKGPRFTYFTNPRSSDIPLRALESREVPGVFFAGRCLSATHEALASVRVMGTSFATGQAAGLAASLHARGITPTGALVIGEIENL